MKTGLDQRPQHTQEGPQNTDTPISERTPTINQQPSTIRGEAQFPSVSTSCETGRVGDVLF